ncbi:MAG: hypothetical protein FJY99_00320 [Candidatus Sericytochromatia bacterium]|nr:hypothetical protein [Candidatus Tanganyikabacteria bacterium]
MNVTEFAADSRRPALKALELVHTLGEVFTHAWRIPLARLSIVSEDRFYDLLEELEGSLPGEFEKARDLLGRQQQILDEAEQQAVGIVAEARRQAQTLVQEHEIVRAALDEATRLRAAADADLASQQDGADRYADEVLGSMEDRLGRVLATVQAGRQHLQAG